MERVRVRVRVRVKVRIGGYTSLLYHLEFHTMSFTVWAQRPRLVEQQESTASIELPQPPCTRMFPARQGRGHAGMVAWGKEK